MIKFNTYVLPNGLKLIHHFDDTTPLVAVNTLFKVGSKNETPDKTGFAHLFEHLMFGGSLNIPSFDEPVQLAGGENNAFTNNDITNYYISLPVENIETAFWLESDRMNSLDFSQKSLDIQKNVVIEEFNQRYLNQPYGDVWLLLREMAYTQHPYQWPTIGKKTEHIANATLDDVKEFFFRFYSPRNAILSVAGNIEFEQTKQMVEKWYGGITNKEKCTKEIPVEPEQTTKRTKTVKRDVPFNAIYMGFHMVERNHKHYPAFDLISDILSNGKSSRLYKNLVMNKKLFSSVNAYITGDIDPGLFVIQANLHENTNMELAEKEIFNELQHLHNNLIDEYELTKVKNRFESYWKFSETGVLNKAMNLALFDYIGDANQVNFEIERYKNITPEHICEVSRTKLIENNCSVLYYYSEK